MHWRHSPQMAEVVAAGRASFLRAPPTPRQGEEQGKEKSGKEAKADISLTSQCPGCPEECTGHEEAVGVSGRVIASRERWRQLQDTSVTRV